jgi:succinylarginine dihydrolase
VTTREFNFDGLIGPTHNYSGLSFGNIASAKHQNQTSHPRAAALQGLEKMKTLAAMGIGQCVLPPLRRPRIEFLRQLGFQGRTATEVIHAALKQAPQLVAASYSAASMWTANAATVSPSADCSDNRVHLTAANLNSTLHRSLEGPSTAKLLRAIFSDSEEFFVHNPLPSSVALVDEGAANHTRLCDDLGGPGLELFVYGSIPNSPDSPSPKKFPSRQSLLASQSVVRHHDLRLNNVFFWQQNPDAIDAGVFHNDVISVGNQNVLLTHEMAFVEQAKCLKSLSSVYEIRYEKPLHVIEFSADEISMEDTVKSYLFNSQLVTRPDGKMSLVCPIECEEIASAQKCTERILSEDNPVDEVKFLNLRQSMNNGGGPACLRLRVVLTEAQQSKIHQGIILTETLAAELESWIKKHYRESIHPDDLLDPELIAESYGALEALADILRLPTAVLLDR